MSITDQNKTQAYVGGSTIESRLSLLYTMNKYIEKNYLFGYGADALNKYIKNANDFGGKLGGENYSLMIAFEFGIIGLIVFYLYYFKIFKTLYSSYKLCVNNKDRYIMSSFLSMFFGWIIFVNLIGELNSFIFQSSIIGLGIKYGYLMKSESKIIVENITNA